MSYETSLVITDKYRNRVACKDVEDLEQPKFYELNDEQQLSNLQLNYPVIVKPTGKGGKRGITVVTDSAKYWKHINMQKKILA